MANKKQPPQIFHEKDMFLDILYSKRDSAKGIFLYIVRNFKEQVLWRTSGNNWKTSHEIQQFSQTKI